MTSNIAIARGALDNIPPIALASSRWFLVFLVFLPFVYSTLITSIIFIIIFLLVKYEYLNIRNLIS